MKKRSIQSSPTRADATSRTQACRGRNRSLGAIALLVASAFTIPGSSADEYPFSGNPPITPRWAYEHWVWEDTTNTQASTIQLVEDYKSRNIPVGAVIIDSPWSTAYMNFTFDSARYPDPQAMITNFRNQGIQVVCWMVGMINQSGGEAPLLPHPSLNLARTNNYQVRNPANGNDIFSYWKGAGLAIDFTNPEAVDWFMGNGNPDLIQMGVRGFKVDESNAYVSNPVQTSPGSIYDGEEISKDVYTAYYHAKVSDWIREQTADSGNDGLVISRPYSHQGQPAGFHCPVSKLIAGWCGDYSGDFPGFAAQVSDIYTSANAGYSALGFEVGGYYGASASRDSLLRQAQFAALVPIMENGGSNGGLTNHVPWYWDNLNGTTTTVPIYRYYATLHRNLAPFLFHTGVVANRTGTPAITQTDIGTYRHLLGDVFLTRGVMSGGDTSVVMKFPSGHWIDWWNQGDVYEGNGQATVTSSMERAPIYVRAGSIVPANVDNEVTGIGDAGSSGKETILIYPQGTTSLTYHRALGDGIAYEDVLLSCTEGTNGTVQVLSPTSRTWLFKVKCFSAPGAVTGADSWSYDSVNKVLSIEKTGADFSIQVEELTGYSSIQAIPTAQTNGTDTWTGLGSSANWSVSGNWSGANAPPFSGDSLVFAGSNRLENLNDLAPGTTFAGLSFNATSGAFSLGGNGITLAGDLINSSAADQTLSLDIFSDSSAARQVTASATSGKIIFNGEITRNNTTTVGRAFTLAQGSTNANGVSTYEFGGPVSLTNPLPAANDGSTSGLVQRNATTVNLNPGANVSLTGGYWSVGQNNSTSAVVQPATLNLSEGASLHLSSGTNFNIGHNFNSGTNTNPNSGILNLNGGMITAAMDVSNTTGGRYVRLGVNGSTSGSASVSGVINLNGGRFTTSRTFVRGGSLANTGTSKTQQTGSLHFNGGTLATDGVNDVAEWFQSSQAGSGNQLLPLNAVRLESAGGTFDTAGRNASTGFPITGPGGLTKTGEGNLTLSGNVTYTGPTSVHSGTLKVSGSLSGSSSLAISFGATVELSGTLLSISGDVTNDGTLRHLGTGQLHVAGTFVNNGVLDLINGPQDLPPNFINNGIVLDSSSVRVSSITVSGAEVLVSVLSYAGHTYQLQRSGNLEESFWQNIGTAKSGNGEILDFQDPDGGDLTRQFYRVVIAPE